MELQREELGEMYSPDNQGEYALPEVGMQNFSVQGLSDVLTSLDSEVTVVQLPAEEYALLLEVTMADQPGHPHPPTFSWNSGMVLHILKRDPTLRDPEHVQVDGPGMAYLFMAILLPLAEGWQQATAALDRQHPGSRVEQQDCPVLHGLSSEPDSMLQLVGSALPSVVWMGQMGEGVGPSLRIPVSQPRGRPPKQCPTRDGDGNSLSSSPKRDGVDSDGYSTISETPRSHHHNRGRHGEKQLAPAHLDMPIFKLTDLNVDITYTLWRFDVQGWLDQYQEESMMPHIYNSLRGYPGRWVCSLDGGQNLTVTELVEQMDHTFGNMWEYDTMIHSLYEIQQKEGESVEEYML